MAFVSIFRKSKMKNVYLPKISILLQFGGEILALICLDDSIQILLILSLQELLMVWKRQSNIQKNISSDFQTPWSWLIKKHASNYFFRSTSWCCKITWNTLISSCLISGLTINIIIYSDDQRINLAWTFLLWISTTEKVCTVNVWIHHLIKTNVLLSQYSF